MNNLILIFLIIILFINLKKNIKEKFICKSQQELNDKKKIIKEFDECYYKHQKALCSKDSKSMKTFQEDTDCNKKFRKINKLKQGEINLNEYKIDKCLDFKEKCAKKVCESKDFNKKKLTEGLEKCNINFMATEKKEKESALKIKELCDNNIVKNLINCMKKQCDKASEDLSSPSPKIDIKSECGISEKDFSNLDLEMQQKLAKEVNPYCLDKSVDCIKKKCTKYKFSKTDFDKCKGSMKFDEKQMSDLNEKTVTHCQEKQIECLKENRNKLCSGNASLDELYKKCGIDKESMKEITDQSLPDKSSENYLKLKKFIENNKKYKSQVNNAINCTDDAIKCINKNKSRLCKEKDINKAISEECNYKPDRKINEEDKKKLMKLMNNLCPTNKIKCIEENKNLLCNNKRSELEETCKLKGLFSLDSNLDIDMCELENNLCKK